MEEGSTAYISVCAGGWGMAGGDWPTATSFVVGDLQREGSQGG